MRSKALQSFERCITENGMFIPNGHVLLAVSGGADSMCLLTLMTEFAAGRELTISAAHVNHGIRAEEADRDEAFVREWCARLGVPLYAARVDVPGEAARRRMGLEECARELRYAFLEQTAEEIGADCIATAHNAEDNAETILMNLLRGTSAAGLAGIAPVRGCIVRPLLYTPRADIEAYLTERGLPHVEDSTNSDTEYTRNYLRHEVMPRLTKLNPALAQTLLQTAELARRDEKYLEAAAQSFLDGCGGSPTAAQLRGIDPALRSRALRRFAKSLGAGELSLAHTEAMERLIMSDEGTAELHLPGLKLRREYGRICAAEPCEHLESMELVPGQSIEVPGGKIFCTAGIMDTKIHSNLNILNIKRAIIRGKPVLRPRMEGDNIRLPGRPAKTLKKLFIEAHVPAPRRGLVPVAADEEGVLAVVGFGVDRRAVPEPGDEIITLRFVGEKQYEQRY